MYNFFYFIFMGLCGLGILITGSNLAPKAVAFLSALDLSLLDVMFYSGVAMLGVVLCYCVGLVMHFIFECIDSLFDDSKEG